MIRVYDQNQVLGGQAKLSCDQCGEDVTRLVTGMTWDEIAKRVAAHDHFVPDKTEPLFGLDMEV